MVTTRLHTAEDLYHFASKEDDYELIDGVLVSMVPPNFDHGELQANVSGILRDYVRKHSLGKVVGEAGFILERDPDTVLAPDVAFVASHRLPERATGFPELAPDLAVEIVSPSNSPGDIERKLAIYLRSGVRSVWVVYPAERQLVVHTPSHPPAVFGEQDRIVGGDVLPGLSLPVAGFFV